MKCLTPPTEAACKCTHAQEHSDTTHGEMQAPAGNAYAANHADMEKEGRKAHKCMDGRVEALYRDAAQSYQEAGRHQAAAEALGRAAVYLEGIDPQVLRWRLQFFLLMNGRSAEGLAVLPQ